MAVTSGFFNSRDGDRKYDARQISELFDGVIEDGVFMHIGETLKVFLTDTPNTVAVGTGRCWFNHVWVKNWPSRLLLELPEPDEVHQRYDAVVVEIQHGTGYRRGRITYVKGEASPYPQHPTLLKEGDSGTSQYPLAYILRLPNSPLITTVNNRVGFSDCPFVVAPAGVVDLDDYWAQWEAQWGSWMDDRDDDFEEFIDNKEEQYNNWEIQNTNEWASLKTDLIAQTQIAVNTSQDAIDGTLAAQLQKQIDDLEFTNNMTPKNSQEMQLDYDDPESWYNAESSYGEIAFYYLEETGDETDDGQPVYEKIYDKIGMIENFVSPYAYKYTESGEPKIDDSMGYNISQILKTTSPTKDLYVRTGYYRDPKYNDPDVEYPKETGWDVSWDHGWLKAAHDKVDISGDTMTGTLYLDGELNNEIDLLSLIRPSSNYSTIGELNLGLDVSSNEPKSLLTFNVNGETVNSITFNTDTTKLGKPLSIDSGGTGANNASSARTNLGAMGAIEKNGYIGMMSPWANEDNWIRTTTNGLLPHQSGGASSLGTSSWPFNNIYVKSACFVGSTSALTDYIIAQGSGTVVSNQYAKWWKFNSGLTIAILCAVGLTLNGLYTSQTLRFPYKINDPFITAGVEVPGIPNCFAGYIGRETASNDRVYVYINRTSGSGSVTGCRVYAVVAGSWK